MSETTPTPAGLTPMQNNILTIGSVIAALGGVGLGFSNSGETDKIQEIQQAQNKENVAQMMAWNKAMSDEVKAVKADAAREISLLRERVARVEGIREGERAKP